MGVIWTFSDNWREGLFLAKPEWVACATSLFFGGCMTSVNDRWCLTHKGVHAMQSCSKIVGDGRLVFGRRGPDYALGDMSTYQLTLELGAQSWEWRRWVAPSQRGKHSPAIPDSYSVGDTKVWYTGVDICKNYLLALLRSQDFLIWVGRVFGSGYLLLPCAAKIRSDGSVNIVLVRCSAKCAVGF